MSEPNAERIAAALVRALDDDGYLDPHMDAPAFYDAVDKLTPLIAAALTEPPGRGPETGPDVALRKELRRAMTVLMEAEAGSLEHFSRHPGSQPRSEQWQSCRICGVVAERIRDVVHRPTCWFKNVAEQIDRLAALICARDSALGSEAPATPTPDGPDGERRQEWVADDLTAFGAEWCIRVVQEHSPGYSEIIESGLPRDRAERIVTAHNVTLRASGPREPRGVLAPDGEAR